MIRSQIIGSGSYLPSKIITNETLAKTIDTTDEWIRTRTGITQRHIADNAELASDMAIYAAKAAILDAGIKANEIDLIINCTTTPDHIFPGTAVKLGAALSSLRTSVNERGNPACSADKMDCHVGAKAPPRNDDRACNGNIPCFDIQAVCAGFVYGLEVADNMSRSGKYKTILLTCAEKMSKLLNWQDRGTCILFGDGAGSVVLRATDKNHGIIDSNIYSDGSLYDLLYVAQDGVKMNGREIFRHAVEKMGSSIEELLKKNNLSASDINYFVPHQANLRIIESLANRLNMDINKVIITIAKHANCSAASIPIAFNELKSSGKLKTGDIILFSAFGAGASWGSTLVKW
jgi:3-oxoacyl-[acyl-carrier-protein] synthase III